MTKVQKYLAEQRKLTRERCEKRARLGELAMQAERTDDENTEADAIKLRLVEIDQRWAELDTAIGEEGGAETFTHEGQGEGSELDRLRRGFSVSRVLAFAAGKAPAPDGETGELQQHLKLAATMLPADIVLGGTVRGDDGVERFAVTAAPGTVGIREAEPLLPVPAGSVGDLLGVLRPVVESGDYVQPHLTTRGAVRGPYDDSTDAAETDGALTSVNLGPERGDVSWLVRATDLARFGGMDAALEQASRDALTEWLDAQAVKAVETQADVARVAAGRPDTYASYVKRFVYDRLDGRYAASEGDLRLLVGNDTLGDMAASYRDDTSEVSAAATIRSLVGAVRVSPLIAAAAASKRDVLIRKGDATRAALIQPVWQGIELMVDEQTKRSSGEVVISARVLSNRKVTDAGAFARVQAQHA